MVVRLGAYALLLSLVAITVHSQERNSTKLQCDGVFSDFVQKVENVAVRGMLVEVQSSTLRIAGGAGFDGVYEVVTRKDDGIGFRSPTKPNVEGFLGRYSGQISVSEKTDDKAHSPTNVTQLVRAVCKKADPLF